MIKSNSFRRQLRQLSPLMLKVYAFILAALASTVIARLTLGLDIGELTRDPIHKTGLHPFVGVLSNIGVLIWCFTAAYCFFAAYVLRRGNVGGERTRFFFYGGLITAWLMVDDLFLFHDVIFRENLGVSEIVTYPLYALVVGLFFYRFRELLKGFDYVLMVLAAGFFAASMVTDLLIDRQIFTMPGVYLFEDGFKFLGIGSWAMFFTRTAFSEVMATAGARRMRMTDGVCPNCGSSDVSIVRNDLPAEVPAVPLAAVHRYEKPVVMPLNGYQCSVTCGACGYSEFYLNQNMKMVSVREDRRWAS
ncbi:MAG: hypothetical protein ACYC5A_10500 [Thermoleophilia bacterium]